MPASTLGDDVAHWPAGASVETLTRQAMPDPFCKEVRHIAPKPGGGFTVKFIDTRTQEAFSREFDCVQAENERHPVRPADPGHLPGGLWPQPGAYRGSGMFLSYTWNDDAQIPGYLPAPEALCTNLLESIYPKADISGFYTGSTPSRK